jgi:cell division protein FtsX
MRISTFFFLTRRGLRNLGKHWAMTIACIASLSVCMTLNSFASLAEVNVDSMVSYLGSQNETVVYLTATTPPPPRWEKSSLPCRGSVGCSMCPNRTC